MALPKEPRQKMINMMYLVLTAMLALNVSAEVINAFETVNTSITTSNAIIEGKNEDTYKSFASKLNEPQTKAKAEIWAPKAMQAKKLADDMFASIESLKKQLVEAAGTHEEGEGVKKMNAEELNAATRLFEKEKKGDTLYSQLTSFRKDIISVLDPAQFAGNPELQKTLTSAIATFNKNLPIDLTVPKSTTGNKYENNGEGWTLSNFHMTPAIAAMTILSKLQNDVRNSESQIVDYCHQQIGAVQVVYDEFEAIAQASRSYAMPGEEIQITAGVGAFSAAAKPDIFINGQLIPLTGGKAISKITASGAGDKTIAVKIRYTKPDGTVAEKDEVVKYTVGTPSGASVFLQKMNVLYIGVDNPLTISGGSVGAEKVKVSIGNGTIERTGGDNYVARPKSPGETTINVNADGKNFPFAMRIKYLPNPAAFVGAKKGGNISSAEFKAIASVLAKLEDSDFQAPFQVQSFKIGAIGGPIQLYADATNTGPRFNGQALQLLQRLGPGSQVFIEEITVQGPDGKPRVIPPMKFSLK
ncbi:MAG: gliding motility protein GldM [Candidatus Pseudobacter hemicellulosilyticus]|uniref:Gliding motility protein GldM n=1 Tax=Candidatus Pseudobacter hemicellulosilyticus TaxID=3121375 RepID=A0AAJ5WQR5_9BACT|nr:MAG: gliding motility protein GldM [Pseudobacter sp.]